MPSPLSTPVLGSKSWQARSGSSREHRRRGTTAARNAGASYDDTFLPPTMTFAFPAEEKYGDAGSARRVGSVGDRTVLEERLVEVRDVVDDDVGVVDRTQVW